MRHICFSTFICATIMALHPVAGAAHEVEQSVDQQAKSYSRAEVLRKTEHLIGKAAIDAGGFAETGGAMDHMDDAMRASIWREIDSNIEALGLRRPSLAKTAKDTAGPGFIWPLRAAPGYPYPGYYVISNFVDHDPAFPNSVKDFSCQKRTYDTEAGYNHKGIDIAMGSDGWNMMTAKAVQIVAAAPGIIMNKTDGNFDRNCKLSSKQWNAVYLQHDDFSTSWYGHMKRGSLTTKGVGARVEAGEYLGLVGSSGNSTGPHLHFEVYDAARKLVDPYAGTCNTLNESSWWIEQKPYLESAITRLNTASAAPVFSACGEDGTLARTPEFSTKTVYAPGETVYFQAQFRDQVNTKSTSYRVVRPDGTTWREWTHTGTLAHYVSSYWYWTHTLESNAPSGTWTFQATFNGTTHTRTFLVQPAAQNRNYAGIWWNAAESGWGISVSHQGDSLSAALFSFGADERNMWALLPGATHTGDATYSGQLVQPTGTPFNAVPFAADLPYPVVGNMSFTFTSADAGTVSYTIAGQSVTRPITRLLHGATWGCSFWHGSRKLALNYQDIWWNPNESGWGLNLSHQADSLAGAMYTFDADRKGLWLLLQNVTRGGDGAYTGDLFRFTGRAFYTVPFGIDPPVRVGTMRLDFTSGDEGRIDYTVNGVAVSKTMQRLAYGSPGVLCR